MRVLLPIIAAMLFALAACAPSGNTSSDNAAEDSAPSSAEKTENAEESGMIEATGIVRYVELEGGFYGLVGDDGRRYDPSGLPDAFQEDGLRVAFTVEPRENVLTSRMWGRVVRLVEIQRL